MAEESLQEQINGIVKGTQASVGALGALVSILIVMLRRDDILSREDLAAIRAMGDDASNGPEAQMVMKGVLHFIDLKLKMEGLD